MTLSGEIQPSYSGSPRAENFREGLPDDSRKLALDSPPPDRYVPDRTLRTLEESTTAAFRPFCRWSGRGRSLSHEVGRR